jgi:hypothetical protein
VAATIRAAAAADARHALDLAGRLRGQVAHATEVVDQPVREVDRAGTRPARTDQHGENFRVGQGIRPESAQPLAGSLLGRQIGDPPQFLGHRRRLEAHRYPPLAAVESPVNAAGRA